MATRQRRSLGFTRFCSWAMVAATLLSGVRAPADGYVVTGNETDPYDLAAGDTLTVRNGGELEVTGAAADGVVEAVYADDAGIEVDHGGTISAAGTGEGTDVLEVLAIGVDDAAVILNEGTVSAEGTATEDAKANVAAIGIGADAPTRTEGVVEITNTGTITANATSEGNDLEVYGIRDEDGDLQITVDNSGDITVTGTSDDGWVKARGITIEEDSAGTVTNSGTIAVEGTSGTGDVCVKGIHLDETEDVDILNAEDGVIEATATSTEGDVNARGIHAAQDGGLVTNDGSISAIATGYGDKVNATGIQHSGEDGSVVNNGSIYAEANLFTDYGSEIYDIRSTGIQMGDLGEYDTTTVQNTSMDSIVARTVINAPDAYLRENSGAVGIKIGDGYTSLAAGADSELMQRIIDNSGMIDVASDITVDKVKDNIGAMAVKVGYTWATLGSGSTGNSIGSILDITNSGTMMAQSTIHVNNCDDNVGAFGVRGGYTEAYNYCTDSDSASFATTIITNSGLIDVDLALIAQSRIDSGEAGAFGIKLGGTWAYAFGDGTATATTLITNSATGVIDVYGILEGPDYVDGSSGVYGVRLGETSHWGSASAVATSTVLNAGTIRIGGAIRGDEWDDAVGFYGIRVGNGSNIWTDEYGVYEVVIANSGTILVDGILENNGDGDGENRGAFGIRCGAALVTNTGTIDVTGTFQGTNASENDGAYGIRTGHGDSTIINAGTINATVVDENEGAGLQQAAGIWAGQSTNVIYQSGTICATGTRAYSVIMGCEDYDGYWNVLAVMNGAAMTGDILNAADNGNANLVFGMLRLEDGTGDVGTYVDMWDFIENFDDDMFADPANFANVPVDASFTFAFDGDITGVNDTWNAMFLGGSTYLHGTNDFAEVLIGPEASLYANFAASGRVLLYGTLAPGNSIGWIETDDFYAASGSRLVLEFTGTEIDEIRILAGGQATLDAGAQLLFVPLGPIDSAETFDFIVLGAGATLTNDVLPADVAVQSLVYDATIEDGQVTITRIADLSDFAPREARSMAAMLDGQRSNTDLQPVIAALESIDDERSLDRAMISLMGQSILGVPDAFASTASDFVGSLGNRTLTRRTGADNEWQCWLGGLYGHGEQDGSGYEWDTTGAVVGADRVFGNLLFGVSLAYGQTDYNEENDEAESDIESEHLGVYARYNVEDWFLTGALSVGMGDADNERRVMGMTAKSSTDQFALFGQIGIGWDISMAEADQFRITPYAMLRGGYVSQDGYQESGAAPYDLTIDDYDRTILDAVFGVNACVQAERLAASAGVYWQQALIDADVDFDAAFTVAPAATFTAEGVEPEDGCLVGNLNLDYSFTDRVSLFVDYQAKLGGSLTSQGVCVGVRIALGGGE